MCFLRVYCGFETAFEKSFSIAMEQAFVSKPAFGFQRWGYH